MKDDAGRAGGYHPDRNLWLPQRKLRFYRVLGLEPGVSLEDLKQAHRDLVKVWHPDRFADDLRLQKKAQEKLKEINEAYEQVLPDVLPAGAPPEPIPELKPRPRPATTPESRIEATENRPMASEPPPPTPGRGPLLSYFWARSVAVLGLLVLATAIIIVVALRDDSRRVSRLDSNSEETPTTEGEEVASDGRAFALGSSRDEVLSVQGTPTSVESNRWMYELSSVDFADGKVEGYANVSRNLRVRLEPQGDVTAARTRGYFTLGSTTNEVVAVQGTPTSVQGRRFRYESSYVDFANGRVESYYSASRNLHVRVNPAADVTAVRSRGYFTLGSSPDEVLAVEGTPTSIEGNEWTYDTSSVGFSDNQVDSYANAAHNLHVQVFPKGDSSAARTRGFFTLGSSEDDVLVVQGTPTSIAGNRWTYELSWVKFDNGKVESYANVSENLRLRVR